MPDPSTDPAAPERTPREDELPAGEPSWPQVDRRSAERRRTDAQDGRARLWQAVTRPRRSQVVVAVLLALVGFAVVTQVRTNQVDDTYAGLREQDLIDILNGLASTTQRAQTEVQRLEERRDELRSDTSARQAALDEARQQAQVLSVLAGTVPVEGPGVVITITEDEGRVEAGPFIDMVQALRSAGAEAMQVNGEVRVVAQTSFSATADGLVVDGRLLEPPFTVDVIGQPDGLVAALRFPDGPQDQFREDDDAELTFEESAKVQIDTTRDPAEADAAEAQQ
jgi:uncharacterized protein YlxW (UPF0749 family)